MNQYLKTIQDLLQQGKNLSEADKEALLKAITDADKQWSITEFKLDRTEKVKKTTAILLEETIEELEQKRKAVEAQNKELEIEAALEKVRSRSLAMHKSDELNEVVSILFEKLKELQIPVTAVGIGIYIDGSKDMNSFVCGENKDGLVINNYRLPYFHHKIWEDFINTRKKQLDFFSGNYSKEEKNSFYKYVFEHTAKLRHLPDDIKSLIFESPTYTITMVAVNNALFNINDFEGKILSENEVNIIKRFAKVFDQAYTRFLDLQKAEAQARESQIQLALERVRARTMAMQKSDELTDVAGLLFSQLTDLGIKTWTTGFNVWSEDNNTYEDYITSPKGGFIQPYIVDTSKASVLKEISDARKSGDEFFVQYAEGERLKETYIQLAAFGDEKQYDKMLEDGIQFPSHQYDHFVFGSKVSLMFITYEPVPEAHEIFKRFGQVFEQTYTRFLDLQKAEAQAREAQIEAALERVRSRTMAMHKSSELLEAAELLFDQVKQLGAELQGVAFAICDKNSLMVQKWTSIGLFSHPYTIEPGEERMYEAWKNQTGIYEEVYEGERQKKYYEAFMQIPEFKQGIQKFIDSGYPIPTWQKNHAVTFKYGYLLFITTKSFNETQIFLRFGKVFEQTYTRFLDLQKAEAQAREAQIEASLERVRSKTMAMHNSQDVGDTVATLFDEFVKLGIETFRCGIGIIHKEKKMEVWTAKRDANGKVNFFTGYMDMTMHPLLQGGYSGWKKKHESYVYELKGDDLKEYFSRINNNPDYPLKYDIPSLPSRLIFSVFYFPEGFLFAFTLDGLPAEATKIFKRFSGVFGQTYRRYLDLQKAEAQTREAQIEAALERVRSKTMAMHNSQDVGETVATLFDQLVHLGVTTNRCGILIFSNTNNTEVWTAKSSPIGEAALIIGHLDVTIHPMLQSVRHAWKNKETFYSYELAGDNIKTYYSAINNYPGYPTRFNLDNLPSKETHSDFFFPEGAVFSFTSEPIAEEAALIFKRFAGVFGQTYRRYLDLQKAEAQAREAMIEAALERVRGKAMAMHNSNDLSSTASIIFTELRKLGINPIRCGVGLLNKESRKAQLYSATSSPGGDSLSLIGWVMLSGHPVLENIYDTWLKNEEYYPELSGKQLKSYYELLLKGLPVTVPDSKNGQKQYGTFLPFSIGCLYAWSESPYNEAEIKILKRFATIIDLTFRRYLELQKSETTAREVVKQAALDRIRADIASMRTVSDLERITPLIWNELTILGIPFIRCGVFIMDESQQLIHTFLSTPDGKAIAAFHLPYNITTNIAQVLSHWRDKKNYIDHWDQSAFAEFANILVKQGELASAEQYLRTIPGGGFYLHFLPFLQGMLYVGNTTQLSDDEIKLIQSVADAFSTAYARYEDFNKLEAAKKQVDSTLNELQVTQKQLIQSEKMASLGELTAGIAHEIQNPLNFVNNFSDVSNELLEEMKTELAKGNTEDAMAIADDVKLNLEKILHHGKRADAIVKGMLQHSRTGSGQKELTDINNLADEYFRLAYHGLRAKDKIFNAAMKTEYDEKIGLVKIIPQDVGRVILNLITNAFYTVTEKKKIQPEGYEPVVTVSTKKINGKVEVHVKDNGTGIPQKALDKIFQPFFTTKPTGQGTGLGLSLSYDIITKGHDGELKVETKEGEGTCFIISIPITK